MYLYDSLTETKIKTEKPKKKFLRLFVCGPTVYDHSHIGHARIYVFFDSFVKYLRSLGWRVFYLQNITDIDDKIIKKAKEKNENPLKIARRFETGYLKDLKSLNVTAVSKYARASDFIKDIIKQIKTLIDKKYAYKIDGDGWYFDISRFKDYGKLSKRTVTEAEDGISRIDDSIKKKNKGDFCLWKFVQAAEHTGNTADKPSYGQVGKPKIADGEPFWNSPLGPGRPGWHIEDTAISERFFGPQYDIHGGGLDLKFPHHEAEITQQESASGKNPFVKIWMHIGLIRVNGAKMSKSLGNFITIKDFLRDYSAAEIRYFILNHHYRSPINLSDNAMTNSNKSLKSIIYFLSKLSFLSIKTKKTKNQEKISDAIKTFKRHFLESLEDDFNTPKGFGELFNLIYFLNQNIWDLSKRESLLTIKTIKKSLSPLGLSIQPQKIPPKINTLAEKRDLLRGNKQFIQADTLRKKIEELGYEIEDTPLGTFIFS